MQTFWFASWEVSSLGRVKNTRGVISWGAAHPSGYRQVVLGYQTDRRAWSVHRLVAFMFHGPPPTREHVVNHIDGNRINNRMQNLEYVTHSENRLHYLHYLRSAANQKMARWGKPVQVLWPGEEVWRQYPSITVAAETLGINSKTVGWHCHRNSRSRQGYQFRLVDEPDLPGEVWVDAICPRTGSALVPWRISSHGRVETTTRGTTFGSLNSSGYRVIRHRGAEHRVHRIMMSSFCQYASLKGGLEVNHKDGDKNNNHLANLELVTRSANVSHAWGLRMDRSVVRNRRAVEGRKLGTDAWLSFSTATEAGRYLKVHPSRICQCCRGHLQTTGMYEWRYSKPHEPDILPDEVWHAIDVGQLFKWRLEGSSQRQAN